MKVICISGKACHGKDTLAKMLKEYLENHGNKVLITHFGDPLKFVCEKFFDWDGQKNEEGRTLLQYVSTDVVRKQEPNFWVDFIKKILTWFPNEWDYVLIPDCRFQNEFECFKNNNFDSHLIKIERPNYDSNLTEQQLKHPSETSMDNYQADFNVINDSSLANLKAQIPKIVEMF